MLLAAAVPARADEAVSEAPYRLRVGYESIRSCHLRVDLPMPLARRIKGVGAYTSSGTALPASLLRIPGGAAVEVYAPRVRSRQEEPEEGAAEPMALEVHLFEDREDLVPLPVEQRAPVILQRTSASLTTRPFTTAEMRRLFAAGVRRMYSLDMDAFGAVIDRDSWKMPPERRSAVMVWTSDLWVRETTRMAFGADTGHVAWAVFLDGAAVAGWQECEADEKGRYLGEVRDLPPGLYRLEYMVVQRHGEPIPAFLCQRGAGDPGPIPPTDLVPVRYAATLALESRDGALNTGVTYAAGAPALLRGRRSWLTVASLSTPFSAGRETWRARVEGLVAPVADGLVWAVPGRGVPAVTVAGAEGGESLTFPGRCPWDVPHMLDFHLKLGPTPPVLRSGGVVTATVDMVGEIDEPLAGLRDRLLLVWEARAADGAVLASAEIGPPDAAGSQTVSMEAVAAATELLVRCVLGDMPVCEPARLRLLRPGDDLSALTVRGDVLSVDGVRAIGVCDPLPVVPDGAGAAAEPGFLRNARSRVAILDDFWVPATAPDAALLPEGWLEARCGVPVQRRSVRGGSLQPGAVVAKFGLFPDVLGMRPDVVVLAVGGAELTEGLRAERLCLHLLFLAQACRARDIEPVFIALPVLPGVSESATRRAALLVKELAYRLQAGVVDAFSRERLAPPARGGFARTYRTHDGALALATPNDRGRTWLCEVTAEVLIPHGNGTRDGLER